MSSLLSTTLERDIDVITGILDEEGPEEKAEEESDAVGDTAEGPGEGQEGAQAPVVKTLHCTMHNAHYTLHTAYCTLNTAH